jgi:hypothetical protein
MAKPLRGGVGCAPCALILQTGLTPAGYMAETKPEKAKGLQANDL